MSKQNRIKELVELLNRARRAYEQEDREIMSNFEYDKLYDELVTLEEETGIILSNSPTQNVGFEVVSNLPKVKHEYPARSLSKTKVVAELIIHIRKRKGTLSWKLDGLTVVCTYEGGKLVSAVTRGNGEIGEDITANARTFMNLPLTISCPYKLVVRGEAVISYKNFEKINTNLPDEEKYKNPRNLASGSVRQLDSSICAQRNVEFIAYDIMNADKINTIITKEDEYFVLQQQGFDVVYNHTVDDKTMESVVATFTEMSKTYDYPVDGLVLAHNDLEYGRSLGSTSKHPLHSIAFKWKDAEKETKLINVEWQTSRTGMINPVAVFEPVELEGTNVERASVHNVDIFEELELGIGDTITCFKANMIIPQVADNLTRSGGLTPPSSCPVCGAPTEIRLGKTARNLYCTNDLCGAKIVKRLAHFVSRNGMNIDGLSEATLEKFVDAGIIKDAIDIYGLSKHKTTICKMEGMGLKSYNKLIMAIEKSKTVNMANFIYALGIPNVGLSTAKDLVKAYNNDINRAISPIIKELVKIDGIGEVVAKDIYKYFVHAENRRMVLALVGLLTFEKPQEVNTESSIAGKTFVITGDVNIFKNRKEVQAKIESLGGKVSGSVSKNTDYLINNDNESSSSKNQKAKQLNVPIITEAQFVELIGEQSPCF